MQLIGPLTNFFGGAVHHASKFPSSIKQIWFFYSFYLIINSYKIYYCHYKMSFFEQFLYQEMYSIMSQHFIMTHIMLLTDWETWINIMLLYTETMYLFFSILNMYGRRRAANNQVEFEVDDELAYKYSAYVDRCDFWGFVIHWY